MVFDNSFVTANVMAIPRSITAVSISAESTELKMPLAVPIKNIVSIEIIVGNLPLQGTKLFVSIASSLSRGESMIRHPTTPAALHPNPIHMLEQFNAVAL